MVTVPRLSGCRLNRGRNCAECEVVLQTSPVTKAECDIVNSDYRDSNDLATHQAGWALADIGPERLKRYSNPMPILPNKLISVVERFGIFKFKYVRINDLEGLSDALKRMHNIYPNPRSEADA